MKDRGSIMESFLERGVRFSQNVTSLCARILIDHPETLISKGYVKVETCLKDTRITGCKNDFLA